MLVHFFDFAQLNSVRALPYAIEWGARYRDAGLTTLGVHSPRFRFTAERAALGARARAARRRHPVADDSSYTVWHDYGCKGWPSLFLWGRGGALRWFHFGEGEYAATEAAIQDELRELDALAELPPPLEPLRPSDAPGRLSRRRATRCSQAARRPSPGGPGTTGRRCDSTTRPGARTRPSRARASCAWCSTVAPRR